MSGPRAVALALAVVLAAPWLTAAPAAADDVTVSKLDNGVTVMVRENRVAPVVAIALLLRMGSRWETPANSGISRVDFSGTVQSPTTTINQTLTAGLPVLKVTV